MVMMQCFVEDLTDRQLNWAVAQFEGIKLFENFPGWAYVPRRSQFVVWDPVRKHSQGGAILARERISCAFDPKFKVWMAYGLQQTGEPTPRRFLSPNPLRAGLMAFVDGKAAPSPRRHGELATVCVPHDVFKQGVSA